MPETFHARLLFLAASSHEGRPGENFAALDRRTRVKLAGTQGYHSQKQINILLFLGTLNSPFSTSHVYPPGQQCLSSLQQTACETGQQPYKPECSLQHVLPLAHSCFLSGQSTEPEDSETGRAGDFTKVIIFCTSPLLLS